MSKRDRAGQVDTSTFATTLDARPTGDRSPDPFSLDGLDGVAISAPVDGNGWVEDRPPTPTRGWRRALWRLTGGRITPAPDAAEMHSRRVLQAVRRPFTGARTIAVVSTKGGVGKTTTTLNLGHTLASTRGDRVVALDANPDAGSLGLRIERETRVTASDLLTHPDEITSYAQIRAFTSQAPSRLEVLASSEDPRRTDRMGKAEYQRLLRLLRRQYNLVLADCGTGILDPATRGVVQAADQLVVVTGPSVDAARAVSYLLAWLQEHGMADKVRQAVVVINGVRKGKRPVDITAVADHFGQMVRDVVVIPWDRELSDGAAVELAWLAPETRQAYLSLAASIVDDLVRTNESDHPDHPAPDPGRTLRPAPIGGSI